MKHVKAVVCAGFSVLIGGVVIVTAGPLTPPAGPVSPTYKTLQEVEPRIAVQTLTGTGTALYQITQPGSYYLTGNITGVAGKAGISISAANVSLDLNGFTMNGAGVGLDAILATTSRNLTVTNGVISGWAGTYAVGARFAPGSRLEKLQVNNSGEIAAGSSSVIRDCTLSTTNGVAIETDALCIVDGCSVQSALGIGITVGTASVVTRCAVSGTAASGGGPGIGIFCSPASAVTECTVSYNASWGIDAANTCMISRCTGGANTAGGIRASGSSTVTGCAISTSTGPGFQISNGCTVKDCTTNSNSGPGFVLGSSTTVSGCTAGGNGGDGFHIGADAFDVSISGCVATGNTPNGIGTENGVGYLINNNVCSRNTTNGMALSGSGSVTNNTCEFNGLGVAGASGIRVGFNGNRVEGNHVTQSTFGIFVASGLTNNLVVRNEVAFCTTPYSLPAGVAYGAVNNLVSGQFVDTNAWANLRF